MEADVRKDAEDRSLSDLISELTRETSTLIRQEVDLAKTEISAKASLVAKDVGMLAAGVLVAYAGILTLIAALVILLAQAGMPWWGSALLVGVVIVAIGGLLVRSGINALRRTDLTPRRTIDALGRMVHQ